MRALVLGGGVAGLATALALARCGHEVQLIERDGDAAPAADPEGVFAGWQRPGIAQFRQPHNFLGLGRQILRDRLPDVHRELLSAGAVEVEQFRFVTDGTREPGDEDLATLACRRPVFDAVMRRAALQEPRVNTCTGTVIGLIISDEPRARVEGVALKNGERVRADLVVDAMGRGSPTSGFLLDRGVAAVTERVSECGLIYFSRHYRLRPHAEPPPYTSLLAGPRGDLGYLAFAAFVGDNRTFSVCIMTPPWDRELRAIRDPSVFTRVAQLLPGMDKWVDPGVAAPITPVLPMGQLRNTLRHALRDNRPVAPGLVLVGDALCHTNPTFAFGASLSLDHAWTLADVLAHAEDPATVSLAFHEAVGDDARRRFEAVTSEDRDRARFWRGEPIDPTDRHSSMPLFLRSVVYRVAPADSAILRAAVRRIDLLDPPERLEQDVTLLDRASELFNRMRDSGAFAAAAPSRARLLDVVAA